MLVKSSLDKIIADELSANPKTALIGKMIENEAVRQKDNIELIASENFCSEAVRLAMASCLTNKYAEGYPTRRHSGREGRYYGGCQEVNALEEYCCDLWRAVYKTNYHVNVQPHSGTQANMAAYAAVIKPGDTILSMSLANGGHLSHGSPANFSGKLYEIVEYGVTEDGFLDYTDLEEKLYDCTPQLIVVGASAYSRVINFKRIYDIIQSYRKVTGHDIYYMVDMAHIAGLVAGEVHPTPFGYADIITTTSHKSLRGPRGALIFCRPELAKVVDGAVFPGNQGGPLEHVIAAKAICAAEALEPSFKDYTQQVVNNTKAMANRFIELGYDVVTGGTDNHLFLLDFSKTHPELTGARLQEELDKHRITLNKNCVPGDKRGPNETSGVRIGCAAMTTKGWKEKDTIACADLIDFYVKEICKMSKIMI